MWNALAKGAGIVNGQTKALGIPTGIHKNIRHDDGVPHRAHRTRFEARAIHSVISRLLPPL
jgi:hypothetical protein